MDLPSFQTHNTQNFHLSFLPWGHVDPWYLEPKCFQFSKRSLMENPGLSLTENCQTIKRLHAKQSEEGRFIRWQGQTGHVIIVKTISAGRNLYV